ncbi:unnamed protein product [Discula destructiva]
MPSELLRAGVKSLFGGQMKRAAAFFTFGQPQPSSLPQATTDPKSDSSGKPDSSKKRKDPHDSVEVKDKKKRRKNKSDNSGRSRTGMSRRTPRPHAAQSQGRTPAGLPLNVIDLTLSDDSSDRIHGLIGTLPSKRADKRPTHAKVQTKNREQKALQPSTLRRKQQLEGTGRVPSRKIDAPQPRPRTHDVGPRDEAQLVKAKKAPGWEKVPDSSRPSAPASIQSSCRTIPEPGSRPPQPTPAPATAQSQTAHPNREAKPQQSLDRPNATQPQRMPRRPPKSADDLPTRDTVDKDGDSLFDSPQPVSAISGGPQPPYPSQSNPEQPVRNSIQAVNQQPRPRVAPRVSILTREQRDEAARQMEAIKRLQEEPRRAIIHNATELGSIHRPEHAEVRRAREQLTRQRALLNKENRDLDEEADEVGKIAKRKTALKREVERKHPDKSQEWRATELERRVNYYIENKKAKKAKQQKLYNSNLPGVNFLENGHEMIESADGQQRVQAAGPSPRRIPAHEATGSRPVYMYRARLSEPHDEGDERIAVFNSTKVFTQLSAANQYAKLLLDDLTPPNAPRKSKQQQAYECLTIAYNKSGLLSGTKKLLGGEASGKVVSVFVEKYRALVGDLEADGLRNQYVDKESANMYAPIRYQVSLIKTYPKVFKEAIKHEEKTRKRNERQPKQIGKSENTQAENALCEAQRPAEQLAPEAEEQEEARALTGEEVRRALAKGPPATHLGDEDGTDDGVASSDSDDGNQSDGTTRSSSPAGDSYDRNPRNPYAIPEVDYRAVKSFTDRELAANFALEVAKAEWKPRVAHMDAHEHWKEVIIPYLTAQQAAIDPEDEELILEFPAFAFRRGKLNNRIWGFVDSKVTVQKMALEGPMDLDIPYVQDVNDVHQPAIVQRAADIQAQESSQAAKLVAARVALGLTEKRAKNAKNANDDEEGQVSNHEDEEEQYSEEE